MRPALAPITAIAFVVAACGKEDRAGQDKPVTDAWPLPPYVDVKIEAPEDTRYQMLCDIRTYAKAPGEYVKRYDVDKSGPFSDTIYSPSAHCTAKIVSGAGQVTITLSKSDQWGAGLAISSSTRNAIYEAGDAGKIKLDMW